MGTAAVPQVDPRKDDVSVRCGRVVMDAVREGHAPARHLHAQGVRERHRRRGRHGGSTNAVLHLLAMAREAGVPLTIDDFDAVCARTPLLVDLKPGGRFVAADVDKAGGIPVIAKRLLDGGYVDGSTLTVHRPHVRRGGRRTRAKRRGRK